MDPELDPVKDEWASFFEFQYEPDKFNRLLRLSQENVMQSKHMLVDALRRAVQVMTAAVLSVPVVLPCALAVAPWFSCGCDACAQMKRERVDAHECKVIGSRLV